METTKAIIGWFDNEDQDIPANDPPHDGPCLVCRAPLHSSVVTTSLVFIDTSGKSYFYRAHKGCIDDHSDGKAIAVINAAWPEYAYPNTANRITCQS